MKISDGYGQGYQAKVSSDLRLLTDAVSAPAELIANKEGEAFFAATNSVSMSTGEHKIFYMKNTSDTYQIIVDGFALSHNGGTTSGNKSVTLKYYLSDTTPTANQTASTIYALNGSSSKVLEADFYTWDGVGTGMTVSGGLNANTHFIAPGITDQPLPGKFILDNGDSMTISMECAEAFLGSVLAFVHILR